MFFSSFIWAYSITWVDYWSSMFSSGYPSFIRYCLTFSRWSPWSIICPFFAVPPQAQKLFSCWAIFAKFVFLSFIPSTMVVGLPNFRVSSLMRILCCSFSISLQTHKSLGSPHIGQISAMTLKSTIAMEVYKIYKFCINN
jgi:hypothetical protein